MKEYGDEFVCGDRDVVEGSQMNNSTSSVSDEGFSRPQGTWIREEVEDDNADSALLKTTNLTLVENPGGLGTHSQGGLPLTELAFPTCV